MAQTFVCQPPVLRAAVLDSCPLSATHRGHVGTKTRAVGDMRQPRKTSKCDKFLIGSSFEGLRDMGNQGQVWKGQRGTARRLIARQLAVCAAVSTGAKSTSSGEAAHLLAFI